MMHVIELSPDLVVRPSAIAAVKRVGKNQCAVFLRGQSAVDGGFLAERDYEDVVEEWEQFLDKKYPEHEDDGYESVEED